MNVKEKEEFAVMKNEITHIKKNIDELKLSTNSNFLEVKKLLETHTEWELEKYDNLKQEFAPKWVEKVLIGVIVAVTAGIILGAAALM